jgi:hypothetical protein
MRGRAASDLIVSAALLASCGGLGGGFYPKGPGSLDQAGDGVSGFHGIGTKQIPGIEGNPNKAL